MQDRYMRCNQACEDEMKDLMQVYRNSDGSPQMVRVNPILITALHVHEEIRLTCVIPQSSIEPKIVACVEKCTSSHVELLPVMMERLRTSIPK